VEVDVHRIAVRVLTARVRGLVWLTNATPFLEDDCGRKADLRRVSYSQCCFDDRQFGRHRGTDAALAVPSKNAIGTVMSLCLAHMSCIATRSAS
jgi:hypothetical protein